MVDFDEQLKEQKNKLKQLKNKKMALKVKGLYVIEADIRTTRYDVVRDFYVNSKAFMKKDRDSRTSGDDTDEMVDGSWPPYDPCPLGAATDTRGALQYRDFLFTKQEAIKFASKSPVPKQISSGIISASKACPGFDFFSN